MKFIMRQGRAAAFIGGLCFCGALLGQTPQSGASNGLSQNLPTQAQTKGSADADWSNLNTLALPQVLVAAPPAKGATGYPPSPIMQEITALQQASVAAHSFYSNYPSDVRSAKAKKLEVMSSLQGAQLGGHQYTQPALALATSFRSDTKQSVHDRFDVAMAAEALSLPIAPRGKQLVNCGAARAQIADRLYAEFGDQTETYNLYLNVMWTADPLTSAGIARKLLAMKAPPWAKATAQQFVDRQAMIGKPLNLVLTKMDGRPLDLKVSIGMPTVILVWSNSSGNGDLTLLGRMKPWIPPITRMIYLCLQANLTGVKTAESQAPVPGIFCFEQAGMLSRQGVYLKVQQLPFVYVLNKDGTLSGCGQLSDLPTLLSAAAK